MPRYWFVADDEISLIQLQKNAFIFNWRRRENNKYPHFNRSIKPDFDRLYSELESFLATDVDAEPISIDLCELTYVNTVEQCDYWTGPGDTSQSHSVVYSYFFRSGEWCAIGFQLLLHVSRGKRPTSWCHRSQCGCATAVQQAGARV